MLPIMMGAQFGMMALSPLMMLGGMGGMGGCCGGILGGGPGAMEGGLLGGLTGGLLGGGPGALVGGLAGGILGGILGERRHHHCCPGGCGCYPPPGGCGGFGGYSGGGYGCGMPGMMPGMGMANQAAMYQMMAAQQQMGAYGAGYQQGYQQGAYQQGYQQGFQAGQGYGPNYFGNQYGCQPCGGPPPGYGYNGGCCPPQGCCPGQGGAYQGDAFQGNPGGQLQQNGQGQPMQYTTSGGFRVSIDHDKVTITDPTGKQTVQQSGDPHEYVDGQHVKDWQGDTRTILLPDGTRITMNADGPNKPIQSTSIYDGNQNVQIDNNNNQVTHQSFNPWDTQAREQWQPQGETAGLKVSYDGDHLSYDNLYNQDNNFNVSPNYQHIAGAKGPWYDRPFFGLFGGPRVEANPAFGHGGFFGLF